MTRSLAASHAAKGIRANAIMPGWIFLIPGLLMLMAALKLLETQRARDLMTRLAKVASPLGLYAEEFDVATGRHLGNFPQAFSHLALVEAAGTIIVAERVEELGV